jgi:hypothetical protein
MAFAKNQQQAEKLAGKYLKLQQQKEALDSKLLDLKAKIVSFSKKSNIRSLKTDNNLLHVFIKEKTLFPKKGDKGRKQIEEIMRNSKEWKQAITFDIIKLGTAYDRKKLSHALREKLKPFTKKEEVARIYIKNLENPKNKKEAKQKK